ncbi:hypothetical protein [Amycolatopsis anabasis]|uniref:hypothetical protein n=1 Tax=Amycolatopsis anabasis TaxID=1840409 RepID=UPI001C553EF1|nr:hypothetical protein [Amycolatopsis anabasis]
MVLPSGEKYWTVLDEQLAVVEVADAFLRHVRFGRDQAELTTKSYASAVALYLRWCGRTARDWRAAVEDLSLFITWLRFAPRELTGLEPPAQGATLVLAGPGAEPVRGPARIAGVLVGVRAFLCHAAKICHVGAGEAGTAAGCERPGTAGVGVSGGGRGEPAH